MSANTTTERKSKRKQTTPNTKKIPSPGRSKGLNTRPFAPRTSIINSKTNNKIKSKQSPDDKDVNARTKPEKSKSPSSDHSPKKSSSNENNLQISPKLNSVPIAQTAAKEPTESPVSEEKSPVSSEKSSVTEEKSPVSEEKSPVTEEKSPVSEEKSPVSEEKSPPVKSKVSAVIPPRVKKVPKTETSSEISSTLEVKEIVPKKEMAFVRKKQRKIKNAYDLDTGLFDTKPKNYEKRFEDEIVMINGKSYRKVRYLVKKKAPTGQRRAIDFSKMSEAEKRVIEADYQSKFIAIQKKVTYLPIPKIFPGVDLTQISETYRVYSRAPQMIDGADFYKGILHKVWLAFRTLAVVLDLGKPVSRYFDSLIKKIDRYDIMFKEMAHVSMSEAPPVDPWTSFYKITGLSVLGGVTIIAANHFVGNPLLNGYVNKTINELLGSFNNVESTGGNIQPARQPANLPAAKGEPPVKREKKRRPRPGD